MKRNIASSTTSTTSTTMFDEVISERIAVISISDEGFCNAEIYPDHIEAELHRRVLLSYGIDCWLEPADLVDLSLEGDSLDDPFAW